MSGKIQADKLMHKTFNTLVFYEPFPLFELEDDLILRGIRDEDAPDYLEYMRHPQVMTCLTDDNIPGSLSESLTELRYWGSLFPNKRSFYWGIAVKSTNRLIGTIGFNNINFRHLKSEISYDLDYNFWGRGIMFKALQKVAEFAKDMNLVRIQATVITTNERSIKVLEKCGFTEEGILRKYEIVHGEHKDYYLYAKL
jgi:[ribosomal protein S5]-alanine N-acetyltransferase